MSTILFLLRADKSAACNLVVAKLCLLPSVWIVWSWIIAVGTLWAATSSDPCPASCRSRVLMMRCICPGTGTWTQQQQLCEYVGRMVQSCSIASVSRSAPINCDITERAFGICRPEISTRALVNVTGGGGHYPTMILLGFLTSAQRLPYNLCFPSSSQSQGFSSQWIYRSNRRQREEEVILHIRPHKYW